MRRVQTYAFLVLVAFLAGCAQLPAQPDLLDTLTAAENTVTAAANTLADARDAGIVAATSDDYQRVALRLLDADEALDIMWRAYATGDLGTAAQQRDAALAIYREIRPTLAKYAEVD